MMKSTCWLIVASFPFLSPTGFAAQFTCTGGGVCDHRNPPFINASTNSPNTPAVLVSNGSTLLANQLTSTASGVSSNGLLAQSAGRVSLQNSTITTTGIDSGGVLAQGANTRIDAVNISINTSGASSSSNGGSFGVSATDGATVSISHLGQSLSLISTTGSLSPGLVVTNQGIMSITNTTIRATGNDSIGLFATDTAVFDPPNQVTLNKTSLFGQRDAIVVGASFSPTALTLNVNNHSNIQSGNGILLEMINGPFNNTASIVFNAQQSTLAGNIISNSALSVVRLNFTNGTVWTGAGNTINNMTLGTSSIWNMTADSVVQTFTNGGTVVFGTPAPGPTFKNLTVGFYSGANGFLTMNTFLQSSGSPSDLLVLTNGPLLAPANASGLTGLTIRNAGGLGDLTTGNGILVVNAVSGATTSPTAFYLAAPAVAGPYEYNLVRGSVDGSAPDNWYLRSEGRYNPVVPLIFANFPNYRSEVSLYSALPSLAILYTRGIMSTLHQRVSQHNFSQDPCSCYGGQEFAAGAWIRLINSGGKINNGSIFVHGPDFKYHYLALETGLDLFQHTYLDGGRDYAGVLVVMGDANSSVEHFTGLGSGKNTFLSYSLGAYYTHYDPMGWYLDAVAMGNKFDIQSDPDRLPAVNPLGNSFSASLEAGYPFALNENTTLEPQAQVIYQTLAIEDVTDIGATVRFNRTPAVTSRLGLLIGKTWCPHLMFLGAQTDVISGFARFNYWHESSGKSVTKFSSATGSIPFISELAGNFMQIDFGLSTQLTKKIAFYANAGEGFYLHNKGHFYDAAAGLRMTF